MDEEKIKKDVQNVISFVTSNNINQIQERNSLRRFYQVEPLELDEIIMDIKDRYEIDINQKEYKEIDTLNDIVNIIMKKI